MDEQTFRDFLKEHTRLTAAEIEQSIEDTSPLHFQRIAEAKGQHLSEERAVAAASLVRSEIATNRAMHLTGVKTAEEVQQYRIKQLPKDFPKE